MRRWMYCKCWQWIGVIAVCVSRCRIAECFVGCRQGRGSPFRAQVGFELTLGKSSAFWTRITGETGARIIRSFRGGASSIHRRSDVGIVHLWWLVGYEWLDFVAFDVPTCRRGRHAIGECHSLESGCSSLPLSLCRLRRYMVRLFGIVVRRSFYFVIIVTVKRGSWWRSTWLSRHNGKCYFLHRNPWLSWYYLVTILDVNVTVGVTFVTYKLIKLLKLQWEKDEQTDKIKYQFVHFTWFHMSKARRRDKQTLFE